MNKASFLSLSFRCALIAFLCSGTMAALCPSGFAEEDASHSETSEAHDEHDNEGHEESDDHGHDDHGHGGHDEHGEHEEHPPELLDLVTLIAHYSSPSTATLLTKYVKPLFFSILDAVLLGCFFMFVGKRLKKIPGRLQGVVELYVETIDGFVCGILGKEIGRIYVPFLGTLAIYIFVMNIFGLVPFFMSPTSIPQQTFGLSVCVFVFVQWTAFKYLGFKGYLFHLMGDPQDAIGWALSPLFLVLHVMGELIKPLSLGLRLFGNILGEDILMGVFAMLGILAVQAVLPSVGAYIGIPLHFLVLPIIFLGSTIQATVFMVLSTIYISLVLPHEDHGDHAHA